MELEEYKSMFDLEEEHWWYRGLRKLLLSSIQELFKDGQKINILDAGCGTGFNLKCLKQYGISFGIDISGVALRCCQRRELSRIAKASVLELPFSDGLFDLVVSTDVLYHKAVEDDNRAINEISRVLKKGGILIVNLPAHNYLRRKHDQMIHTRHRYTRNELRYKLQKNKFKIIKISYRNAFSFFILFFLKLISKKNHKRTYTDLKAVCNPINSLLYSFLALENSLLKRINIPFGTSIFCISRKTAY
ncbi:class I SAM-dependent methyltransferase [bacterium]|nr:class I SAM-dependent methyltransferase [bacterium]